MFWKKEKKTGEKRSLEDMFKPNDDVEDIVEDCVVEEVDEIKNPHTENEPIKPFDCFGMEESKTDKWLMKCVKFWFCCMSFVWFLFGAATFAPIIFISNKVNVIFKDKKKSLLCSTGIYAAVILLIFLFVVMK